MRVVALIVAGAAVLSACIGSTQPVANTGPVTAPIVVPALDRSDQPSYGDRTGQPPALSLQELFHPTFNAPLDPSRFRTLLVTGDVIPARGVDYFATVRHDFLWPFRPTAAYAKNADVTYINLETPLFAGCPVNPNSGSFSCAAPTLP